MTIDDIIQKRVCDAATCFKSGENVNEDEYIPPIWKIGFRMDIFVETIMHKIGHGVLPSVLELTEAVFSEHKLWTSFEKFANPILKDIASFRLDWCKVKSVPRANWLNEDDFGYGRLMLFLYGQFLSTHVLKKSIKAPFLVLV